MTLQADAAAAVIADSADGDKSQDIAQATEQIAALSMDQSQLPFTTIPSKKKPSKAQRRRVSRLFSSFLRHFL